MGFFESIFKALTNSNKNKKTVGDVEKELGLSGVFRDKNGRDIRSDKLIETILKEQQKKNK